LNAVIDGTDLQAKSDKALQDTEEWLISMLDCTKPIVAVVRGQAIGISFTMLNYVDFIYCTKDTMFAAPFMASA